MGSSRPDTSLINVVFPDPDGPVIAANSPVLIVTLTELIKYAKDKPDELIVGTAGIGTTTHLAGELLAYRTGIKLRYAHYRSSPPAVKPAALTPCWET